jgi:hypothetical protein
MASPPTLARVRTWQKKREGEDPGVEAGLIAGMCVALLWAVLSPMVGADSSLWWGALKAFGAALGVSIGGMIVGLLLDTMLGVKHAVLWGTGAAVLVLAGWSLRGHPPWFAAVLAAVGTGGLALGFRQVRLRAQKRDLPLSEAAVSALLALPKDVSAPLAARVDAALSLHQQLLDLAAEETRIELEAAAESAVLAVVQQVTVVQRLAGVSLDTPALTQARAAAQAALDDLDGRLVALVEATALHTASRQASGLARLKSQAEALRVASRAWAEVDALDGGAS